ncbi:MAG: choice-of-anchor tandem repeat GloVer-containing protein, partial [Bacteroidota bacterium]
AGPSGSLTLLRLSVPETDYHLAGTADAYVTAIAEGAFFTTAGDLYSLAGGTATQLLDFTAAPASTGNAAYNTTMIDGKIWGLTFNGGTNDKGVVYRIDPDGSNFTKVADFNSTATSASAFSIIEINGKVYGTTNQGGSGLGEIWSANPDGTGYSIIHTFDGTDLFSPLGQLVEYGGKLYGVTLFDVTNNRGGVFSLDYDGSNYAVEYLCTTSEQHPQYGTALWNNLIWFPNGNGRITGWNPVTKAVNHTLYPNGSSHYEPVVIENELWVANSQYIQKFTSITSPTLIHTFATADDVFNGNGQLSYDGTRIWGTAQDGTSTYPVVYSILPDGTDLQQEYKGTVAGFPSNNVTLFTDVQTPAFSFPNQTVEHLSVSTLAAQTSSTGAVSYTLVGDATGSGLSGDQLTAGTAGTVTVRATVAANDQFTSATADATFTIVPTNPTATFVDVTAAYRDVVTLAPAVTNYTGGTITYAFVTGGGTSATGPNTSSTISGDQLTVGAPGTETIRATFPANGNFNGGTFDFPLTISNATADLSGFTDFAVQLFQGNETLSVPTAPGVAVQFDMLTSNTGSSLSGANNATLTVGSTLGTETIRVTVIEPNYNATTKDVTMTLEPGFANITFNPPSQIEFNQVLDSTILQATADIPGTFSYSYQYFTSHIPITLGVSRFFSRGDWNVTATFVPDDQV